MGIEFQYQPHFPCSLKITATQGTCDVALPKPDLYTVELQISSMHKWELQEPELKINSPSGSHKI